MQTLRGLHVFNWLSIRDRGQVLLNEDVFSGTGEANMFLVVVLERSPLSDMPKKNRILISCNTFCSKFHHGRP